MEKTSTVSFLSSITTKVTLTLMLLFIFIIALVFYVVNNEGYDKIRAESSKLSVEAGKLAVAYISSDLARAEEQAVQLRNSSQVLPVRQSLLQQTIDTLFAQNTHSIPITTAGIFPTNTANTYGEQSSKLSAIENIRHADGKVSKLTVDPHYTQSPWYQFVGDAQPQNCLWSHTQYNELTQQSLIDCSMPIVKDSVFWGTANISIDSTLLAHTLQQLNDELEDSYALLFDNSNQLIASSDVTKLPTINPKTAQPYLLNEYVQTNTAWQRVADKLSEQKQQIISVIKPQLFAKSMTQLELIDLEQTTEQGSMLLNYAANQKVSTADLFDDSYMGSVTLDNDGYLQKDAQAYVFTIPDTNWNLVLVQSKEQTNAVAENLSKNIIKYVLFALLFMLALIFFLLDFLALRPMEDTAHKILEADRLINRNQYNKLSDIQFPKIKNDEMGVVNGSLKKLLRRIEDNEGKLANINQQLEVKVEERTAELQTAMTELKASQVQLIRSEKMATLGQMVAGVAHEVNTPLTYVQNNVEIIGQLTEQYEELVELVNELKTAMMDEQTPEDDIETLMEDIIGLSEELEEDEISSELKDLIKDSLFGVEQITEMVLNLRNFARLDESKVKKTDLRECISSSLKIAQNTIKHHQLSTDLQDIPEIDCSPSQVNQVIINLLNNASQAIGTQEDGQISIRSSADNDYVYIDIKDNGSGMSEEVLAKIFEPFFTTKAAGDGTGLGMAISQQIMEQHNGKIQVKSTEGIGTLFRLVFPIHNTIQS